MPRGAAAAGDVGAGLDGGDEARDVLGLVLQVAVHRHDDRAARAGEPGVHRRMLAEVALEADGADVSVARGEPPDDLPGAVARAVVDEDQLVVRAGERLADAAAQLLERRLLVEERDDDRERRSRVLQGEDVRGLQGREITVASVRWQPGDTIVRREVWRGQPTGAWGGYVLEDTEELVVLYMPGRSPLAYTDDFFGSPHPWSVKGHWVGHGVVQLYRPGAMHSVWAFWEGARREFAAWYVNIEEPWRRTRRGYDTQDLELDIVIEPTGAWRFKDEEKLDPWVARGRWTATEVAAIRAEGARIGAELDAGRRWWSEEWARWEPDPSLPLPELPADWHVV